MSVRAAARDRERDGDRGGRRGRVRVQVRVHGTVQGVGFRPFVYRLAGELGLGGYVLNDAHGVLLEVEGTDGTVDRFLGRLTAEAPPLAVLEDVLIDECRPTGEAAFAIRASPAGGVPDAPVTPDTATCEDCLRELMDPADRRFRYPFINCTNCGPRFTIVRGVPYDRPLTTMAGFSMCPACRAEYEDPADRRFHAQPNACPDCGPALTLVGAEPSGTDPLAQAAAALRAGAIVAVKGIGGYHLACRADDETAVAALRSRKHREDKPFALMVASLAHAESLVMLDDADRALLTGPARPIVLAPRRADAPVAPSVAPVAPSVAPVAPSMAPVAPSVAPGAPELGVMLPYTPLHHLLVGDAGTTLVMTSGNVSDEPIAYRDDDALARLGGIADLFLVHDRPIHTRTDDSVVRAHPRPVMLRRSRGLVPAALPLPAPGTPRPLLACGAELKSTFCLAKGERAWVSHHIGDLENYETLRSFTEGIDHFARLFAVAPEVVAHDLHPEYLSTKYALARDEVRAIGVQHHHAHLAAALAEAGHTGPALGAIFDGTGYGTDGTVWGGELLLGDTASSRRVGMLRPVVMPGGRRAIEQPWRMACAWLWAALDEAPSLPPSLHGRVDARNWDNVARLIAGPTPGPMTSSMGRLFDAVAALTGLRAQVTYEGQAAMELEAACAHGEPRRYPITLDRTGDRLVIDPRETILAVLADVVAGRPAAVIAAGFHATVAAITVSACAELAAAHRVDAVALSGGVFQNRRLLETVLDGLAQTGLDVLVPRRLPVNDGGIAYGQAVAAAARLARRDAA